MKTPQAQETTDQKTTALCAFLDCSHDDIREEKHDFYGLSVFRLGSQEFAIGTDAEADSACVEYCNGSAWAFRAEFLASLTELPIECFAALSEKCESGNDAIVRMIEKTCGIDAFVAQAISADGRGHFLSSYDGEECTQGEFYIYRLN